MAKINAMGKVNGYECEVECSDTGDELVIGFNGEEDEQLERQFRHELNKCHAVGGTYHPPQESMINALNVLEYYFFDEKVQVIVEGDIGEIPGEKDVIY